VSHQISFSIRSPFELGSWPTYPFLVTCGELKRSESAPSSRAWRLTRRLSWALARTPISDARRFEDAGAVVDPLFQRSSDDDPDAAVPAMEFLNSLPAKVAAEINAILDAVAKAPPPAFSGGGKWEAMHGEMAGVYEVRVRSSGANHCLFCLLVRASRRNDASYIVCLGGLTKPIRSPAQPRDYVRVMQYVDEFRKHGNVLQ
jgi:Txe/YoeB family toxin of Txe-Axe toxin-antitoxin module